jgi:hypothetical protein
MTSDVGLGGPEHQRCEDQRDQQQHTARLVGKSIGFGGHGGGGGPFGLRLFQIT